MNDVKKIWPSHLKEMKQRGERIAMLTAYDALMARLLEQAGIDVLLVGDSFQTFVPMEAFKHSVHAVINSSELFLMKQLVEKAVAENELFLHTFREIQNRIITGGKN